MAFFSRVAAGYANRMQEQPLRFARVASGQPMEAVWRDVRAVFESRGWLAGEGAA